MIERPALMGRIRAALKRSRVVALLGPRQCGKTTLAGQIVRRDSPNYFDLEDPDALDRLREPKSALQRLRGVVVIDEVQRRPDLFPLLRVLADRRPLPARFLVLGSASPDLLRQSSESLAGRIETIELSGFSLAEVGGGAEHDRLWLRGGFPRSYLARSAQASAQWRRQFIQTFLERDVPTFGFRVPAPAMLRFWNMVAHYHGQTWNAAEPARSLGIGETTVRRYLDLLTSLLMVRQLLPWHENVGKRQVKAPKVYIRDSGIFHELSGIRSTADLLKHPKLGASWEGWVLEEILRAVQPEEAYYWRTHAGAELDLLMILRGRRYGVEIKRQDSARMTPSMRSALADLKLAHLAVVFPGEHPFALGDRASAIPFRHFVEAGAVAVLGRTLA